MPGRRTGSGIGNPLPKKKMVVTGRHSKPRTIGGGDPVIGFLKSAAEFVKEDTKAWIEDPIGKAKSDAKLWWTGAKIADKKVGQALKREAKATFVDEPRRMAKDTYKFFKPDVLKLLEYQGPGGVNRPIGMGTQVGRNLGALSSSKINDLLGVGEFVISPQGGRKLNLEEISASRFPKHYGKGDPFKRSKIMQLPETIPHGDTGLGGRIPWLVHPFEGSVPIGNLGESHGMLGKKLARRIGDSNVRRVPINPDMSPTRDAWLEGWVSNATMPGDPRDIFNVNLATNSLTRYFKPENTQGLRRLIEYLTDDLYDADIFKSKLRGSNFSMTNLTERQGSRANRLLDALGGPMTEHELRAFAKAELKRKRKRP